MWSSDFRTYGRCRAYKVWGGGGAVLSSWSSEPWNRGFVLWGAIGDSDFSPLGFKSLEGCWARLSGFGCMLRVTGWRFSVRLSWVFRLPKSLPQAKDTNLVQSGSAASEAFDPDTREFQETAFETPVRSPETRQI